MAHLKDQEFLKQLVYISWHDSCMQSWGRRLEPGLSGWIWSRLPLPSSCHPHTAVTRACNTYCGCGFGLGGGTVNHSTSPLCLLPSVSLSVRVSLLLSVSPSQRHRRTQQARHGLKFLCEPQTSPFPHPTLIDPLLMTRVCTRDYTYVCDQTHARTLSRPCLFEGTERRPSSSAPSLFLPFAVVVNVRARLRCRSLRIERRDIVKKKHWVEVHNHLKLTASPQNSICVDHLWALWQRHICDLVAHVYLIRLYRLR